MKKISPEFVKYLVDYLLKSPCPSNEVQKICVELQGLPTIKETPNVPEATTTTEEKK